MNWVNEDGTVCNPQPFSGEGMEPVAWVIYGIRNPHVVVNVVYTRKGLSQYEAHPRKELYSAEQLATLQAELTRLTHDRDLYLAGRNEARQDRDTLQAKLYQAEKDKVELLETMLHLATQVKVCNYTMARSEALIAIAKHEVKK